MPQRRLRIGVDARLVRYRRGIGNFVHHLLAGLVAQPRPHDFFLYVDEPSAVPSLPVHGRVHPRVLGPRIYPVWEQLSLARAAVRDRLDVLYCPANSGPLVLPSRVALVPTVHDVMYLLPASVIPKSPSLYQRVGRSYLSAVVPRVLRRARAITTISEYSRDDIREHVPRIEAPISVIYEAPGPLFQPWPRDDDQAIRSNIGVTSSYFLALGAVDPRKNTDRIIEAFANCARTNERHSLVISGMSLATQRIFQRALTSLGVAERVTMLGFVTEAELVALYRGATALVYPSLYEGFGMPVLEAMACGTPVIASTSASIPEIAGDAALLVDPNDVSAIAQAMIDVATDHALAADLSARGIARAGRFTWDRVAADLLQILEGTVGP